MRNTKHKLFHDILLKHLHNDLDIIGIVRNHFVAVSRRYYRRYGKSLSYAKMSKHLTKLKKLEKYRRWNIPYSWALQNMLKRLAQSFGEIKTLGRGRPRFKKCKQHKGMAFSGDHCPIEKVLDKQKNERNHPTYRIRLNGRWYRFALHRRIEGQIKRGMKALFGKQVSDLAFGEFYQKLKHQAQKRIRCVLKINRWSPTTKCCCVCEHENDTLTLADRHWTCRSCHTHLDRDQNAAINILKEGVASFGLGVVRPIVLFNRIVGCSVEASNPLLNSTNAPV